MIKAPKARPVPAPLRSRINRLAHSHAIDHEARLRAIYLVKVQAAIAAGLPPSELVALIESLNAPEPKG